MTKVGLFRQYSFTTLIRWYALIEDNVASIIDHAVFPLDENLGHKDGIESLEGVANTVATELYQEVIETITVIPGKHYLEAVCKVKIDPTEEYFGQHGVQHQITWLDQPRWSTCDPQLCEFTIMQKLASRKPKTQQQLLDITSGVLEYIMDLALYFEDDRMTLDYDSVEDAIANHLRSGCYLDSRTIKEEPHAGDCCSVPMTCRRCLTEDRREGAVKYLNSLGFNFQYTKTPVTRETTVGGRAPRK